MSSTYKLNEIVCFFWGLIDFCQRLFPSVSRHGGKRNEILRLFRNNQCVDKNVFAGTSRSKYISIDLKHSTVHVNDDVTEPKC